MKNNENNTLNQFDELEPIKVVLLTTSEIIKTNKRDERVRIEGNRETERKAKKEALEKAIEHYCNKLESMDTEDRLHFYLANSYVVYKYSYMKHTKDGRIVDRNNIDKFKIELSILITEESYTNLRVLFVNFCKTLATINNLHADANQDTREMRKMAKKQLGNIFQSLATEKYKKMYIANHNDLERIMKMQNIVMNDKEKNNIYNEAMINLIT